MVATIVYIDAKSVRAKEVADAHSSRASVLRAVCDFIRAHAVCFPSTPSDMHVAWSRAIGLTNSSDAKARNAARLIWWFESYARDVVLALDAKGRFMAGCVVVRKMSGTTEGMRQPPCYTVNDVCVSSKHRGKGLCTRLISSVTKLYVDRKQALTMNTSRDNAAARACYRRLFKIEKLHSSEVVFEEIRKEACAPDAPVRCKVGADSETIAIASKDRRHGAGIGKKRIT
jgi:predicted acetyltransferase